MNKIELPKDRTLATKVIDSESAKDLEAMRLGKIGVYLGSRENAMTYLTWALIILCVLGATCLGIGNDSLRPDVVKALLALAISALGYMFGKGHV